MGQWTRSGISGSLIALLLNHSMHAHRNTATSFFYLGRRLAGWCSNQRNQFALEHLTICVLLSRQISGMTFPVFTAFLIFNSLRNDRDLRPKQCADLVSSLTTQPSSLFLSKAPLLYLRLELITQNALFT